MSRKSNPLANPDAERFTLGALLDSRGGAKRSDDRALLAELCLSVEDFTVPSLRTAFSGVLAVVEQGLRVEVDAVTAAIRPMLPESPNAWLRDLQVNNRATVATLKAHAETLRRLTSLRRMQAHHQAQLEALARLDADPPALALADARFAQGEAARAAGDERGGVLVAGLMARWDQFDQGTYNPYLRCGLEGLDQVFRGFLHNVNLVGGKASMGKTAFVAKVTWGWLTQGLPGGVFGLEDGVDWLLERHVSRHLDIPIGDVGACHLSPEMDARRQTFLGEAHDMLDRLLFVHRTSGLDGPGLLQKAERWIAHGARWLVIDHGGRIQHEAGGARERFDLGIKRTVEGLDNLAHNARVPIIVNWHYNREGAKADGPPTMEAFKESGYLEACAGTMLGLWERPENPDDLLITVLKNRRGARGVTATVPRDARHALVHERGGRVLNLREEEEQKRAAAIAVPRRDWRAGA